MVVDLSLEKLFHVYAKLRPLHATERVVLERCAEFFPEQLDTRVERNLLVDAPELILQSPNLYVSLLALRARDDLDRIGDAQLELALLYLEQGRYVRVGRFFLADKDKLVHVFRFCYTHVVRAQLAPEKHPPVNLPRAKARFHVLPVASAPALHELSQNRFSVVWNAANCLQPLDENLLHARGLRPAALWHT